MLGTDARMDPTATPGQPIVMRAETASASESPGVVATPVRSEQVAVIEPAKTEPAATAASLVTRRIALSGPGIEMTGASESWLRYAMASMSADRIVEVFMITMFTAFVSIQCALIALS